VPLTSLAQSWRGLAAIVPLALIALASAPSEKLHTPPIVGAMVWPLEQRFQRPVLAATDHITGIIALGGDIDRTWEAVRLAQRYPTAPLVVTGASKQDYALAQSQGIEPSRLIFERHASNTYENAVLVHAVVDPRPGQRWLVVTTSIHMPRAIGSFRSAGFDVEPWPIQLEEIDRASVAAMTQHELLGLLAYRLMGRTGELLPAPGPHRQLSQLDHAATQF